MYTLDARKAKGNSELIEDTYYMHEHPLFVLFDCGDKHSLILNYCVKRIGLEAV